MIRCAPSKRSINVECNRWLPHIYSIFICLSSTAWCIPRCSNVNVREIFSCNQCSQNRTYKKYLETVVHVLPFSFLVFVRGTSFSRASISEFAFVECCLSLQRNVAYVGEQWSIIRQFRSSNLLRCLTRINICNTCTTSAMKPSPTTLFHRWKKTNNATVFLVEQSLCSIYYFVLFEWVLLFKWILFHLAYPLAFCISCHFPFVRRTLNEEIQLSELIKCEFQ